MKVQWKVWYNLQNTALKPKISCLSIIYTFVLEKISRLANMEYRSILYSCSMPNKAMTLKKERKKERKNKRTEKRKKERKREKRKKDKTEYFKTKIIIKMPTLHSSLSSDMSIRTANG